MTKEARVLVVGDVIDDIHVGLAQPFRVDTDTEAIIRRTKGGSAANTAVWLASTGVSVDFVGRVGHEEVTRISADFDQARVHAHLVADYDHPTGTIVIVVHEQDRTMLSDRGANVFLDWDSIEDSLVSRATWVHLTGYALFHCERPETVWSFIERAKTHGVCVSVDASSAGFLEDFGVVRFLELIWGADLVRCNKDEALVLTGADTVAEAGKDLSTRFPAVVVTDGARGAHVFHEGVHSVVEAEVLATIVDPTGAGDAFNAGILQGLAQGEDLVSSATRGSALAAKAVMTLGARP